MASVVKLAVIAPSYTIIHDTTAKQAYWTPLCEHSSFQHGEAGTCEMETTDATVERERG